ncbi:hypothetical protein THOG05_20141 [Vibrio rotiferianus]|nr:hypothetical protein THOG05_20141 [Vibrio rotiferianus]
MYATNIKITAGTINKQQFRRFKGVVYSKEEEALLTIPAQSGHNLPVVTKKHVMA